MPIRTKSLEQVARDFVDSYRSHLIPGSAANRIDPRHCSACSNAFDELIFALDGASSPRGSFTRVSGGLEFKKEDKIIQLFEAEQCQI